MVPFHKLPAAPPCTDLNDGELSSEIQRPKYSEQREGAVSAKQYLVLVGGLAALWESPGREKVHFTSVAPSPQGTSPPRLLPACSEGIAHSPAAQQPRQRAFRPPYSEIPARRIPLTPLALTPLRVVIESCWQRPFFPASNEDVCFVASVGQPTC